MIFAWILALPWLWLMGCSGCGEEPLATLLQHQARVERDGRDHVGDWKAVAGKDAFLDGDGLRTFEAAEATLELAGGGKVRVEADTTIRFRRNAPDSATATSVDIESGLAEVEAGDSSIGIKTRFGLAVLSSGGKVRVDRIDGAERYRVEIGEAVFPSEGGAATALKAGEQLDIGIGLAELEPAAAVADVPAVEPSPPIESVDAGVDAAAENAQAPEPSADDPTTPTGPPRDTLTTAPNADLDLPLGGNVTINDPKPPTTIGFSLTGACPEGGALEVNRRRAHGKQLNVPLKPGSHAYRVFCFDDAGRLQRNVVARGTVRVRRATGTAQLPTTAPRNRIDMDGRRYTVMFQNLLPEIDVRWPNAPTASSYTLERTFNGQTESTRSDKPNVRFAPGQIREGEHRLRFKGGGTQASEETTLSVRFDNAAPSVNLRTPAPTGFDAGGEVRVSGMAVADTRVSILGREVALDREHRFDTTVAIAAGTHAFAVRIDHPRTGIHYYVRRERGR